MIIRDKNGTEIKKGDYIIYACSLGRSPGLRYAKVLGFKLGKIKVWAIDGEWNYKKPNLQSKPTYLYYGNRTIVLKKDQLPNNIPNLLQDIEVDES